MTPPRWAAGSPFAEALLAGERDRAARYLDESPLRLVEDAAFVDAVLAPRHAPLTLPALARRARSWEQLDRDYVVVDEDPAPYVLAFLEATRLVLAEGDVLLATGDGARVIGVAAERWDALGAAWARSRGLFDVAPAELHARVRAEPGWAAFHAAARELG